MLMRGKPGRAFGELCLTFTIVAVATAGLLRPDVILGSGGLLDQTHQASLQVAAITTDHGAPAPTDVDPDNISAPLQNTLTSTFVVQPYQLLEFGRLIPPGDPAYAIYLASAKAGPFNTDAHSDGSSGCTHLTGPGASSFCQQDTVNKPPNCSGLIHGSPGWEICEDAGPSQDGNYRSYSDLSGAFSTVDPKNSAYVGPPSWDRVIGALLLLFAALVVGVMVLAMVLAMFATQFADAALASCAYPALIWAIMPGPSRAVLWRWVGSFVSSVLVMFTAAVFLPLFGVAVTAFLKDAGNDLVTRLAMVDLLALAALGFDRRLMDGAGAAGARLANRLRWARIGGSGSGDDATRTGQVIAGALAQGGYSDGDARGLYGGAFAAGSHAHLLHRARLLSSARALGDIPGAPLHPGRLLGDIRREAAHGLAPPHPGRPRHPPPVAGARTIPRRTRTPQQEARTGRRAPGRIAAAQPAPADPRRPRPPRHRPYRLGRHPRRRRRHLDPHPPPRRRRAPRRPRPVRALPARGPELLAHRSHPRRPRPLRPLPRSRPDPHPHQPGRPARRRPARDTAPLAHQHRDAHPCPGPANGAVRAAAATASAPDPARERAAPAQPTQQHRPTRHRSGELPPGAAPRTARSPRTGRRPAVKKLILLAVAGIAGLCLLTLPLGLIASGSADADTSTSLPEGLNTVLAQAYQQAATRAPQLVPGCTGMTWQILAGVAQVESDQAAGHTIAADGEIISPIIGPALEGTGTGGNTTAVHDSNGGYAHALGPFQFLASTWATTGLNGRGTTAPPDVQNAFDASLTAAVYLCGSGRDLTQPTQLHAALYSYNRSNAYVDQVEAAINQFEQVATAPIVPASGRAAIVIQAALAQRGVPYSWGGGNAHGPTRGICCSEGGQNGSLIVGFDCSGLTLYAYAQAGTALPRTAAEQAKVGRRIPASAGLAALRPGDLIFYAYIPGDDASIYHVTIYLGGGQQVAASRPGVPVDVEPVTSTDFAGGAAIL